MRTGADRDPSAPGSGSLTGLLIRLAAAAVFLAGALSAGARAVGARPADGAAPAGDAGAGPAVRLLPPVEAALSGRVRLRTVIGPEPVARVVFVLDDAVTVVDERPPFEALIDLGPRPREAEVEVEAYDADGRLLGGDRLLLDPAARDPEVRIASLVADSERSRMELTAELALPAAEALDRLEVYWRRELVATLHEPPYRVVFDDAPDAGPGVDGDRFAQVVAHTRAGGILEAVALPADLGPVEAIDVRLVEVLALIDGGVRGPPELDRGDFRVRYGGERLALEQFAPPQELPLELGLVVDASESMTLWLEVLRESAAGLLRGTIGPADRAFLVEFDTRPRLLEAATGNVELLTSRLEALEPQGDTALHDAVLFALLQFERQGRRALVVITDGLEYRSHNALGTCLEQARALGVPVYFLITGSQLNEHRSPQNRLLGLLAARSGGSLHYLPRPAAAEALIARLQRELANQYLLAFSTDRALSGDELRALEVDAPGRRLRVRALPRADGGR